MKLRIKFALLSIFVLVLPVIITVLGFLMDYVLSGGRPGLHLNSEGFNGEIANYIRTGVLPGGISWNSDLVQLIVLRPDGTVEASTMPSVLRGEVFSIERFLTLNSGDSMSRFMFEQSVIDGTRFTALIRVQDLPRLFYRMGLSTLLYSVVAVFVGAALLAAFMLRRTSRALQTLKTASLRLAAGDLDYTWTVHVRDEIGELSESFDAMRVSLKEERAKRSRFLMAVTHDLRTPLTSVRGYLEAFEDGLADDKPTRDKYLAVIRDKARLLENRIGELLDFVKMETGEWKLMLRPFELAPFLDEVGASFAEDGRVLERDFSVRLELPPRFTVTADEGLLIRVLENLVHNAFRYTEKGGRVVLAARADREGGSTGAVIEVRDDGSGIPVDERQKIFEPFYRGTRTRNEPGFGLGLSIVKSIVEAHGWALSLGDEAETVFRIAIEGEKKGH